MEKYRGKWDVLLKAFLWELSSGSSNCCLWPFFLHINFVSKKLHNTKKGNEDKRCVNTIMSNWVSASNCYWLSLGCSSSFWTFGPLKCTCSCRLYLGYSGWKKCCFSWPFVILSWNSLEFSFWRIYIRYHWTYVQFRGWRQPWVA